MSPGVAYIAAEGYGAATFMMMLRKRKKALASRGFVKKSAMLSAVLTKGTWLELEGLDHVAHEEMAARDVLGLIMVLRVVREVARRLVVAAKERWSRRCRRLETAH